MSPDFRRAVLGVTGMDYGNVLVQRSTDFAPFGSILYPSYPDQSLHPWLLDLVQQLWDRGDPDGYAQFMTSHPLPDTPSHTVLMMIAYGDHQVSMYAGALEARTIGASAYQPALDLSTNRARDRNLFYGLPTIKKFPFNGSAIEVWDSGPGHTQPPPVGSIAPPADGRTAPPPVEFSDQQQPFPSVALAGGAQSGFARPGAGFKATGSRLAAALWASGGGDRNVCGSRPVLRYGLYRQRLDGTGPNRWLGTMSSRLLRQT